MVNNTFGYKKSFLIFFVFMVTNILISITIQYLLHLQIISYLNFKLLLSLTFIFPLIIIFFLFYKYIEIKIRFIFNPLFLSIIILFSFSLQILSTILEIMSYSFIPENYLEYYNTLKDFIIPKDKKDLIVSFFSIGIVAPICEEILFRGIILKNLVKKHNFIISNVFQAFLFGIAHLNPVQLLYAVPIGYLLGYILIKTNNLYIPVMIHIFTNSITLLFSIIEIKEKIQNPIVLDFLEFGYQTSNISELPKLPVLVSLFIVFLFFYFLPKWKS